MKKTAVIIGGGLGGLFTGAMLAKEGLQVTVLEKNPTIGGGLQTFTRFGEKFDTGMHVIGGMQPGGSIRKICQYLGIFDKIRLLDVDDDCSDSLYFAEDKHTYHIGKGKKGFIESLLRHFPNEEKSLQAYVDAIYDLTSHIDLFYLRPSTGHINLFSHNTDFMLAADSFIAKYIGDKKLASVLAYINPFYGGRGDETPAYIHAIISVLYINGTSRFVGGSSHLADLLAEVVTSHGGSVVTNDAVTWIEVNNRHVDHVATKSGRQYTADHYISAIHPCTMLRIMPPSAFPRSYRERLDSIPNAYSAFSVFIKLKENTFPYINHSEYYMSRYDNIWKFGRTDIEWPTGFLFMTPPDEDQGPYAKKIIITAPMNYQMASKWEDTRVGHRGESYEQWKEEMTRLLLDMTEEMHPGFRQCISDINTASPLTIRDFFGVKDGSLCGFSKDYKNIALSQIPVVTKVDNLLLTGQNNNLHGFSGVPLTAINTCEAILGINHIINKIHSCVTS